MNEHIGPIIKQISENLHSRADSHFKKYGITFSQVQVLHFIDTNGGQVTQKSIVEYLGVSHPTVVGIVSRLHKNGFITCHTDLKNRRHKIVRTTEKAKALYAETFADRQKSEARLVYGMTSDEIRELHRLLTILYNNTK